MFENVPHETQYFYTDDDSSGAALDGGKTYEITFAKGQEPPVNGFWSLTLYNEHHFFHPNPFSLYIRAYWGKPAILDGSWQPPQIRAAN